MENELSIYKLYSNSVPNVVTVYPSCVKNGRVELNIPSLLDVVNDCFIVFAGGRPVGGTIVEIWIDYMVVDRFRLDQLEVYMGLRNCKKMVSHIVPMKTFFNKYEQNFLPMKKCGDVRVVILYDKNDYLMMNDLSMIVCGVNVCGEVNWGRELFVKRIEQCNFYSRYVNENVGDGWCHYRKSYGVLRKAVTHKLFGISCLFEYVMSFLRPHVVEKKWCNYERINVPLNGRKIKDLYWFVKCCDRIVDVIKYSKLEMNYRVVKEGGADLFEHVSQNIYYDGHVKNVFVHSFCSHPMKFDCERVFDVNRIENIILDLRLEYLEMEKYEIVICWNNLNSVSYSFDRNVVGSH